MRNSVPRQMFDMIHRISRPVFLPSDSTTPVHSFLATVG